MKFFFYAFQILQGFEQAKPVKIEDFKSIRAKRRIQEE
jgi:hypothetical protein